MLLQRSLHPRRRLTQSTGAIVMAITAEDFYRSSNGDRWQLIRDTASGRSFVRHATTMSCERQKTSAFGTERDRRRRRGAYFETAPFDRSGTPLKNGGNDLAGRLYGGTQRAQA